MFALYTYIAPSLKIFTHATPELITLMLVLIGIGFSIGNHLGGTFADQFFDKTLIGFLVLLDANDVFVSTFWQQQPLALQSL